MLKFLTHKLKTHSLNEENPQHKVDEDDHDSGTESDDEHGTIDEPDISEDGPFVETYSSMESEVESVITALSRSRSSLLTPASPYFLDSALPSDCDQGYDQHSSEEELEVINCKQVKPNTGQEKRKWSQVTAEGVTVDLVASGIPNTRRVATGGGGQRARTECSLTEISCTMAEDSNARSGGIRAASSASSDDEIAIDAVVPRCSAEGIRGGVGVEVEIVDSGANGPTPVQFRTSPPRGTHRPYSAAHLVPHEASPRKRHRNAAPPRPCLDFEKMQQLKARAMSAWRHRGDTSGELSVYCW